MNLYGCMHYFSRCQIYTPCCDKFYNCYQCHNKEAYDEETDISKAHKLIRSDVTIIKCSHCNKKQNKKQYCEDCNTCFGFYYCEPCTIFDDANRTFFHCHNCGICRVGGNKQYIHCDKCASCVLVDDHKCFSLIDCPVCYESLIDATIPNTSLNCGHVLHRECYVDMLKNNRYQCPICKKSMIDTKEYFTHLKQLIEMQPMPDQYNNIQVDIYCNDCDKKSKAILHYIATQCTNCESFNTTVL